MDNEDLLLLINNKIFEKIIKLEEAKQYINDIIYFNGIYKNRMLEIKNHQLMGEVSYIRDNQLILKNSFKKIKVDFEKLKSDLISHNSLCDNYINEFLSKPPSSNSVEGNFISASKDLIIDHIRVNKSNDTCNLYINNTIELVFNINKGLSLFNGEVYSKNNNFSYLLEENKKYKVRYIRLEKECDRTMILLNNLYKECCSEESDHSCIYSSMDKIENYQLGLVRIINKNKSTLMKHRDKFIHRSNIISIAEIAYCYDMKIKGLYFYKNIKFNKKTLDNNTVLRELGII